MSRAEILSLEQQMSMSQDPMVRKALQYINHLKDEINGKLMLPIGYYERKLKPKDISLATFNTFGLHLRQVQIKTRDSELRYPRQVLTYVLMRKFGFRSTTIGKLFEQDHTTALHSRDTVSDQIGLYSDVRDDAEMLTHELYCIIQSKKNAVTSEA